MKKVVKAALSFGILVGALVGSCPGDAFAEPISIADSNMADSTDDVRSSDWAFVALQRLVEEYGCLEGYSARDYLGHDLAMRSQPLALTRYEFAADLAVCLDRVVPLAGGFEPNGPTELEIESLRPLEDEFVTELMAVRSRGETVGQGVGGVDPRMEDGYYRFPVGDRAESPIRIETAARATDRTGIAFPESLRSHLLVEPTSAGLASLNLGRFVLSGHYTHSAGDETEGDLNAYMGGVSFVDLFGENNELGIYGGISSEADRDPVLIEAYYKLELNEFFTFTPGLIYTDSAADANDDDSFYGAVRATFSF
ncbi:MAG: carbohydrate porin [Cyanobacteria bacterium J06634_5]